MAGASASHYRCLLASSPALAMITAIGGIATATTDITTAAVTEYNRTTPRPEPQLALARFFV